MSKKFIRIYEEEGADNWSFLDYLQERHATLVLLRGHTFNQYHAGCMLQDGDSGLAEEVVKFIDSWDEIKNIKGEVAYGLFARSFRNGYYAFRIDEVNPDHLSRLDRLIGVFVVTDKTLSIDSLKGFARYTAQLLRGDIYCYELYESREDFENGDYADKMGQFESIQAVLDELMFLFDGRNGKPSYADAEIVFG